MPNIVAFEPFQLARVLINVLNAGARTHAETMVRRMARRNDGDGVSQWRDIERAIEKLQDRPAPRAIRQRL